MPKTPAQKMLSYRLLIFVILAVAYLLVVFHRMSTAVMATDLVKTFNINAVSLGVLGSMYFYPYALMQIPCGILADTIGPRKLVTWSFMVAGLGAFLFGVAPSFNLALVGRFLIGLGVSCVYVPTLKILAVWFRKNEFATLTGVLGGLGALGALVAAAPLAFATNQIGWRLAIGLIGVATLVFAALAHIYVRNHPADKGFPTIEEIDGLPRPQRTTVAAGSAIANLKQIFRNPYIWPLLIRGFVFAGAGLGLQSLWGGPYLINVVGLDKVGSGNVLMMISIGSLITSPLGGYLSDKVVKSRKKIAVLSAVLTVLGWIPLALWTESLTPALITAIFLFMGVAGGLGLGSVGMAQAKELYPVAMSGTVNGVNNFFQMSGSAVYQVILGAIIGSYPLTDGRYPAAAFHTAFVFLLISVAVGAIAISFSKETMAAEDRRPAARAV